MTLATATADRPLVQLRGVGKAYPMRIGSAGRLRAVAQMLLGRRTTGPSFDALADVSFDIARGQSTGLVGVNGAGKSTLLKVIAGVVQPSSGSVAVHGRVGALLELGAGFHPEYTGRQNIALASALLGLAPQELAERQRQIIEFADIGAHIDQPVKHYSSGMAVRLGFAVATAMRPDVLITDEVLAVGDESFQRKCIAWMEDYLADGGTLLLCSHSMYHIQKLCRQAAWIDGGRLRMLGTADDVTREYLAWHEAKGAAAAAPGRPAAAGADSALYQVREMRLNGRDDPAPLVLDEGAALVIEGLVFAPDDRPPGVAIGLVRADGTPVFGFYSDAEGYALVPEADRLYRFRVEFPALPLLPGRYTARSHAMDPEGMRLFDCVERSFDVRGRARVEGFCRIPHRWNP